MVPPLHPIIRPSWRALSLPLGSVSSIFEGRTAYSLTDNSRACQDQSGLVFLQGIRATLRAAKGFGFFATRASN